MNASRALGTTKRGGVIDAQVAHDPRASYGRSVVPTAKRNIDRLGLWLGWKSYEVEGIHDTDQVTPDGLCVSIVRFVRTH